MEKDFDTSAALFVEKDVQEKYIVVINNLVHDTLKQGAPVTYKDIYKRGVKLKVIDESVYPCTDIFIKRVRNFIITLRNNGAVLDTVLAARKPAKYLMIEDIKKHIRPRSPDAKSEKIVFKKEDEWLSMCKISIDWVKKPIGNFNGNFNCTREFV
jgi:hypothetical protein